MTIQVVCAADADYVKPLAAMLQSMFTNAASGRSIVVHVLDGGINSGDKERLAESIAGPHSIRWVEATGHGFDGVPLWGRMSVSTYYKLVLEELLPATVTKVIWLDCDLLVLGDIGALWDQELQGKHALAARDVVVSSVSSPCGVAAWREVGLPSDAPYFNAGVMSIDLTLWRRDQVGRRALDYVRTNRDAVYFWDQEGLNAILAGRWGVLDRRWNHNVSVPGGDRDANASWIVHFAGSVKPWRYAAPNSSHDAWFSYLDRTPWKGWRPERSAMGSFIGLYEGSSARKVLYPLEHWWMRIMRATTRRTAGGRP
jgi:lipopolysaccharide biosynthesis glycosyltransferase